MKRAVQASLFLRVSLVTTTAILVLFAVMYLLFVPLTQRTVGTIEQHAARTVLDHVYASVENIHHSLENNRQAVLSARKAELRDLIAVVAARASRLDEQVRQGRLARAEAERLLLDEIQHTHYGRDGYIWAVDYHSVTLAHGDPKLIGVDFSQKRDLHGNLIVPPMVAGALALGEGYHSYRWQRSGEEQPIEKLTFYQLLPAFNMVIGTGLYVDDIEADVDVLRAAAIEKLRRQLRATRLAKTGYVYLFDSRGNVLIHPNPNLEGKNFTGMTDPATGRELPPMLKAAVDRPEGVRYKWDSPSDRGNYRYDKISWVRYFQPFDWYLCTSVYVAELDESAHILRNRLLAIFAMTLLVSIALSLLLVKWLVAPLKQLSSTALSIEKGDLGARCPLHRNDEIGVVATAFNGMVDRLRDNIQNLDAKVGARTAELEKANQELRQLDQLKSDFISTVSHELRTPMTSIVGFAKLVKKKLDDVILPQAAADAKTARAVAQVRSNLDIIANESQRLTLLINDVLDSAKLDAGKVQWNFSPLAAAALLERAATVTATLLSQKGLALSCDLAPDLPPIAGDEDRLLQVLINLISNAIKFTERGRIGLSAERREGCVRFCVQDTGIGIAPEDQRQVFDKFRQIGDTLTDKPQGSGLGLSICRQIVAAHGGEIWVESEPGRGSTFCFTIPVAKTSGG
ncbi:MAG: HAMP domain-containing protein [Methylococcaceae bacterium]|nr:MAG: HAMP domain-containing protein [Methylococcaceae bacterium]